jgi:hypothetical protein
MGYKGSGKECRYKDTSGKKLDAANPQTTGELPFFLLWEVLRDAKAPRWPRRGVFASGATYAQASTNRLIASSSRGGSLRLASL